MRRNFARTESSQEKVNHRLLLSWTNQKIIFAGGEIVGLPLTLRSRMLAHICAANFKVYIIKG